jgi:hypothetical protein
MSDDDRNVLKRIVTGDEKLLFHVRSRNKTSECNSVESKETESSESENAKKKKFLP